MGKKGKVNEIIVYPPLQSHFDHWIRTIDLPAFSIAGDLQTFIDLLVERLKLCLEICGHFGHLFVDVGHLSDLLPGAE